MSGTEEITIFEQGNIRVTNLRVIIGAKTYALSNITSVEMGQKKTFSYGTIILVCVGLGLLLYAVVSLTDGDWQGGVCGVLLGALCAWAGFTSARSAKLIYTVRVGSASGESNILESREIGGLQPIVNAINEAIVRKG